MAKKRIVKNQTAVGRLKIIPNKFSDCDDPAVLEAFIMLLKHLLAEAMEQLQKLRQ